MGRFRILGGSWPCAGAREAGTGSGAGAGDESVSCPGRRIGLEASLGSCQSKAWTGAAVAENKG
jgi:hypothetical protein